MGEIELGVTSWRRYAAALVPLALAGLLPWWATLGLCLIFGLGAHFIRWHEARLILALTVLLGVIVPEFLAALKAGPALGQAASALLWRYGVLGLALYLNYTGLTTLEAGQRRGLLGVLLSGLLAPGPWLLLSLLGAALLRPGPEDRFQRQRERTAAERRGSRVGWGVLLAGVLALSLFSLGLPRYSAQPPVEGTPQATTPRLPSPAEPAAARPEQSTAGREVRTEYRGRWPLPPLELVSGVMVLALLLFILNLRRVRPAPGQPWRFRPVELLLMLVIAANFVLVVAMALFGDSWPGQGELAAPVPGGPVAGAGAAATGQVTLGFLDLVSVLGWLFFLLMLGLIAFLLVSLYGRRAEEEVQASGQQDGASLQPAAMSPALHRIRVAYREAEDALTRAGQARNPAETPRSYAQRLSGQWPPLAPALLPLTQLYAPVRYGGQVSDGQVSDEQAEQAERLASETVRLAALLPPPEPQKEEPHD